MNTTQEQVLIEKCRNGEADFFKPLMQLYRRQLFSYLFRLSGERTQAEDLFQETLIKTWKGIKKYNEQQKFSSWLFSIAHNAAMDNLRKRKRDEVLVTAEKDDLLSDSNPHNELVKSETKLKLKKAIETLPHKQKEVLLMRIYGEMTFKEIAETTNVPINTVLSHMNYSIKKIKKILGKEDE